MTIDDLLNGSDMPSLRALRQTITEFLLHRDEAAPAEVREKAEICMSGAVAGVTPWQDFLEIVYAKRDECGPIMLQIGAAVAFCFEEHNFSGIAERAGALRLSMRRDAGVKAPKGTKWPAKSKDLDIDPRFAPAPEPEEDDAPPNPDETE